MKAYSKQTLEKYHVHTSTKNVSFLKMAVLLQNMGISNIYFHLKLYDKGLKDVDPFDPNLSDEMAFRVFKECSNNMWYYIRECMRVNETGSATDVGGGTQFILNRGNMAYIWASELNLSTYLIMPRQTGKTWAAVAVGSWVHQFVRNTTILHFNKNQGDANSNLSRIRTAIGMLPDYLQHSKSEYLDSEDKRLVSNNVKSSKNRIGSSLEAMASAGNAAKADALARGKTAAKIWYDELAFIFFNEVIYGAATPAYERAREAAIKNDVPYGISITTTPGDLATPHGAFAYKTMENSTKFTETMYDLSRKELKRETLDAPDKNGFVFIQFSYLQLGETEDWYLQRFKTLNDPIRARREYLLEWINTNGNSPFEPDDVEVIGDLSREMEAGVTHFKINKYYKLAVYSDYRGKKPVLIGVDVASGRGRDSTAVVVVNPETLRPMAVFRSNMIPSDQLKKLLVTLITKRYPNCILTIENNSIGTPLIRELLDTHVGRCIYKEKRKRSIDQGAQSFTKKRTISDVEYGHNTNKVSRGQMFEMLESIVHHSPGHLGLPEIYNELAYLELRNGRIQHSSATHDDVIMAYLGVLWVVRYGTGLKGRSIYYNIEDSNSEFDDYERPNFNDIYRRLDRSNLAKLDPAEAEAKRILDDLMTDKPVESCWDLRDKERAEVNKLRDKVEGIVDDDDEFENALNNLSDSTQSILLRNMHFMMDHDPYGGSTVDSIVRNVNAGNIRNVSLTESILDGYKWDY